MNPIFNKCSLFEFPPPTLGHYLTRLVLVAVSLYFWIEPHREPVSEVVSLSPAKRLVGFEPENFRFDDSTLTN